MLRDTWAVPATGAGVEREFSKSGKVASWQRARLDHSTISETMIYKAKLTREGKLEKDLQGDDERDNPREGGLGTDEERMIQQLWKGSMQRTPTV
jgi:hypothetical protein